VPPSILTSIPIRSNAKTPNSRTAIADIRFLGITAPSNKKRVFTLALICAFGYPNIHLLFVSQNWGMHLEKW
jgi:hypothetical protein